MSLRNRKENRKDWTSVNEMLCFLSEHDIYVVLTGDELLEKGFMELDLDHDIDILVANQRRTAKLLDVDRYSRYCNEHYWVCIGGRKTIIGIYELGDDYMDAQWQKKMLESRILHSSGLYVMDSKNHFFWLLYHALCQKESIPEHYRNRILKEAETLGIVMNTDADMWHRLESFLIEEKYSCPYPKFYAGRVYTDGFQTLRPTGYIRWKINWVRTWPMGKIRGIYRCYLRKKYG